MAAVAAVGISMRIEQIAVMPAIGLNIATLSLVGQNNGAKLYSRVKSAVKNCLSYGFIFTLVSSALVFIFAKPIISLFSDDPEVLRIAFLAVRIATLYISAYILFGISISALQAVKKPNFAIWGALGRQLIGPLLLFPLFTYTFNMGLSGIFWAMFALAWALAAIGLMYLLHF